MSDRKVINIADRLANKVHSFVHFNGNDDNHMEKYRKEKPDEAHPWQRKWDWE